MSHEEKKEKEKKSIIINAANIIRERFGRSIEVSGDKYKKSIEAISSGSILLDNSIGTCKGYPRGSTIEVFGWEGAGKTLLLYLAIAEAQKKYPDEPCVLIDAERQFEFQAAWAEKVGVDISKLIVLKCSTAEECFDMIHALVLGEYEADKKTGEVLKVINPGKYAIIGVDSVTQLVSTVDSVKQLGDSRQRGSQASAIGLGLKKVTSAMARSDVESKSILFFINQLRKNPNQMFGCMHASTKIHTLSDIYSSSSFVKHRIKEKMISYNEQTDSFEEFEPLNYFNNGQTNRENFIKICFEVPTHRMYQKLICTKNHEIFTRNGWIEAQNLAIGDELLSYCDNPLSIEEEQILIGSLLADGFMQTRGCLSASVSLANSDQPEYLQWKIKQLKSLKFYPTGGEDRVSFRSESEMFLLKYYKYFYENEFSKELFHKSGTHFRSFTSEIIDKMDLLALAVLYMDDGSISRKDGCTRASISMKRLNYLSEIKNELFNLLINKFKQFNVDVELKENGLKINNIQYFSQLISKFVIPEMQYKLMDCDTNNYQELKHTERIIKRDKIYTKVIKIEEISDKAAKCLTKYDIQTPTNSYMVGSSGDFSGVVVHNSPDYRTGGNALPFYDTIALKVAKVWDSVERDEAGEILSHDVKVTFEKNKAGPLPEDAIVFTLMHDGSGVNNEKELFDVAFINGVIKEYQTTKKDGKITLRYNFVNPVSGQKIYESLEDFSKRKFDEILETKPEIKQKINDLIKDRKIFVNKDQVKEEIPDSAYSEKNDSNSDDEAVEASEPQAVVEKSEPQIEESEVERKKRKKLSLKI
jgi:RecA/RadA recombinase